MYMHKKEVIWYTYHEDWVAGACKNTIQITGPTPHHTETKSNLSNGGSGCYLSTGDYFSVCKY